MELHLLLLLTLLLLQTHLNPCQVFFASYFSVQPSRHAGILIIRSGTDTQKWWRLIAANEASKISSVITLRFLRLSSQDKWVFSTLVFDPPAVREEHSSLTPLLYPTLLFFSRFCPWFFLILLQLTLHFSSLHFWPIYTLRTESAFYQMPLSHFEQRFLPSNFPPYMH